MYRRRVRKPSTLASDRAAFAQLREATRLRAVHTASETDTQAPAGTDVSAAAGNGYSRPVRLGLDARQTGPVPLRIDQVYRARPFVESERVKLVDIESRLLTEFYGRPTRMRAARRSRLPRPRSRTW